MDKRIIALAAALLAAVAFAGATPAAAGQCEANCDRTFQQCNGTNPDTSACLPKWGQCKHTCSPPKATATTPAKAAVVPPAKVTKVATTTKAKPKT